MDPIEDYLLNMTRRRFFSHSARTLGAGLGAAALSSLLGESPARGHETDHVAPLPHFVPKARRVIYLHMEGAPSQIDLFDYKPNLKKRFDEDLPDSIRMG